MPEPSVVMDNIKFFAEVLGSISVSAITLLGIYLRMYVRDALHDHADALQKIIAANYVRRDVYDSDIRWLRAQIEGNS